MNIVKQKKRISLTKLMDFIRITGNGFIMRGNGLLNRGNELLIRRNGLLNRENEILIRRNGLLNRGNELLILGNGLLDWGNELLIRRNGLVNREECSYVTQRNTNDIVKFCTRFQETVEKMFINKLSSFKIEMGKQEVYCQWIRRCTAWRKSHEKRRQNGTVYDQFLGRRNV